MGKDRRTVGGEGPRASGWGDAGRAREGPVCERQRARPGRAAGTRLGRVWLDAPSSRVGWYFCRCGYARLQPLGVCIRASTWRDVRACLRCVCAALRVALRARVAQRVAPRCSSVGCGGVGRHTRFRMSVRVFTRVDVCAQLSLGETAFACIPACLWVPVSTCVQALCVSVCSRVYMDQYACEYIEGWGFLGAETLLPTWPTARPPGGIRWGKQGTEMPPPQHQCGTLCFCPRVGNGGGGGGGGGSETQPAARGAQQGGTARPHPRQGQRFL